MIPFSPPRIDQKIIDEVTDTLKSGWITTGPKTKLFEDRLTAYCGNKATVAMSSATAGLELMLRWFGVKPGDEVIIPAYTYCATANVVMHCGATPVMVDINKDDFNIDVSKIKDALSEKTKVIMPVDIGGLPCDYDGLYKLVENYKEFSPSTPEQEKLGRVMILSDAAHSFGAKLNDHRSGSLADVSVFSFHAVKNLTTAEGGAIALNLPVSFDHEELYRQLKIKSLHGQTKDALSKTKKKGWQYDVIEPGYKCNMTDLQASIGLIELGRYNDTLTKRKNIVQQYVDGFKNKRWAKLPVFGSDSTESSYHLFMLRIKNCSEDQRNKIIERIFEKQVSVNVHFIPLPLLTAYKAYNIDRYPVTYKNFSCEISLPVFFDLTSAQVETVVKVVTEAVEETIG